MLDNTVAAQNFEYKMSNILDKPLYVMPDSSHTRLTPPQYRTGVWLHHCSQELSVRIGISRYRKISP